jgi:predicted helicase
LTESCNVTAKPLSQNEKKAPISSALGWHFSAMQDVPLEAYDYVVNGKPALEWVMERQVVKTDKASGVENDANRYAVETMNNPAYPLELFQRVITVSLRTMEIVRALPQLEVME